MEENYEDMSNDQLRLKLLEYGFTNMPVTSTTRKVLIKKLRNHVLGSSAKVRRETIHVTKYSSDEDSESLGPLSSAKKKPAKKESTNRRATIGEASKGIAVTPMLDANPPETQPGMASSLKRRSGRVTPIKKKNAAAAQAMLVSPLDSIVMEDSDDDMIPLTQLKQRDRKSKSPSLSRGEMLTTSYIHQLEVSKAIPVEPLLEEMEVDLPVQSEEKQHMETIVIDDYDDIEQESMPPPLHPSMPKPEESDHNRVAYTLNPRKTVTTLERKAKDAFEHVHEFTADLRTKSNIATTPGTSVGRSFRTNSGSTYVSTDSPYLSEFTKRLSRLRTEAQQYPSEVRARKSSTNIRNETEFDTAASTTYGYKDAHEACSSRFKTSTRYTNAIFTPDAVPSRIKPEDMRSSLRQSLLTLDQKYSIRKKFYCVLIVFIIVFLFFVFFM